MNLRRESYEQKVLAMLSRTVRQLGTAAAVLGGGLWSLNRPAVYDLQIWAADSVLAPILKQLDPEIAHELVIRMSPLYPRVYLKRCYVKPPIIAFLFG